MSNESLIDSSHPAERDLEAEFRGKLEAAKLYVASRFQGAEKVVEPRHGCQVYSAAKLREASRVIQDLPDEEVSHLTRGTGFSLDTRPDSGKNKKLSEASGISLNLSESSSKIRLADDTSVSAEVKDATAEESFATLLAHKFGLRALIVSSWNRDQKKLEEKTINLDELTAEEREQIIKERLMYLKTEEGQHNQNTREKRTFFVHSSPDQTTLGAFEVRYSSSGIIPLRNETDKAGPAFSLAWSGGFGGNAVGAEEALGLMEAFGSQGLRASLDPNPLNSSPNDPRVWVTNDDSFVIEAASK